MQFSQKAEKQREVLTLDCFRSYWRSSSKPSNQRRRPPLANNDLVHGLCANFAPLVCGPKSPLSFKKGLHYSKLESLLSPAYALTRKGAGDFEATRNGKPRRGI